MSELVEMFQSVVEHDPREAITMLSALIRIPEMREFMTENPEVMKSQVNINISVGELTFLAFASAHSLGIMSNTRMLSSNGQMGTCVAMEYTSAVVKLAAYLEDTGFPVSDLIDLVEVANMKITETVKEMLDEHKDVS